MHEDGPNAKAFTGKVITYLRVHTMPEYRNRRWAPMDGDVCRYKSYTVYKREQSNNKYESNEQCVFVSFRAQCSVTCPPSLAMLFYQI